MSLGFFHKAKELGHKTERLKPKNFDLIPSQIKVLSVVYFVYMLGAKSIVCFLPIFIESVLSNVSLTGVVVSFYGIAMIMLDIPIGDLVDRIGRKSLLVFGILIRAVSGFFYFISSGIFYLALARFFEGSSISFSWDSGWTMVRDMSPENLESESIALFQTGTIASAIIAPVIGGLIAMNFGFRPLFVFFSFISIFASVLAYLLITEDNKDNETVKQGVKDLVKKDKVYEKSLMDLKTLGLPSLVPLFMILLYGICLSNVWFIVPLFSENLGSSLLMTGVLFGLMYVPGLFKYWFSELSDNLGDKRVIYYLSLLGGLVVLPLVLIRDIWTLFLVVVSFSAILQGLNPSISALVTKVTPGDEMGELTGLFQNFKHLGLFIGPFFAGFMADYYWISAPFVLSSLSLFILATISYKSGFDM